MTTQTIITKRKTTKSLILEMENFLDYKRAQGIAELTMRDYNNTFNGFRKISKNILLCEELKPEILEYFSSKSNASPAKYNRPYGNLTAFFSWAVRQELLDKNPIKE